MIERFNVTIPALTGEKERTAYIYLPTSYDEIKRFPVMYMFDGHNLFSDEEATFGKSWGLSDFLDNNEVPLIIAAVECNHEGNSRLSEYSPVDFTFKNGEKIKGRGRQYMNWLVSAFKPFVDESYKTLSDRAHTYIGGSSMGGLMTLYALAKYGKYFCGGAALSPSLWVNGGSIADDMLAKAKFVKGTYIYSDYGSKEFVNHDGQRAAFARACGILIEKGAIVTARVIDGGTHSEASWERQIPYFLKALNIIE